MRLQRTKNRLRTGGDLEGALDGYWLLFTHTHTHSWSVKGLNRPTTAPMSSPQAKHRRFAEEASTGMPVCYSWTGTDFICAPLYHIFLHNMHFHNGSGGTQVKTPMFHQNAMWLTSYGQNNWNWDYPALPGDKQGPLPVCHRWHDFVHWGGGGGVKKQRAILAYLSLTLQPPVERVKKQPSVMIYSHSIVTVVTRE